jgi:hypothetical protein
VADETATYADIAYAQLPCDIIAARAWVRRALAGGDCGVFQMAERRSTLELAPRPAHW